MAATSKYRFARILIIANNGRTVAQGMLCTPKEYYGRACQIRQGKISKVSRYKITCKGYVCGVFLKTMRINFSPVFAVGGTGIK
jgi:hypothetical protein